jgi:spore maturation protein SpmA
VDIPYAVQQWPLEAVAAIVAGILVLLVPRILNYAVATYLLVVGILGLLHFWYGQTIRPQTVAALVAGILILVKPAILNYVVGGYLILIGILELGALRF